MKVTLKISESLLAIHREGGRPLKETIEIEIEKPTNLLSILFGEGINPLLVPMVIINNKRLSSLDYLIEQDEVITLVGPLAGG